MGKMPMPRGRYEVGKRRLWRIWLKLLVFERAAGLKMVGSARLHQPYIYFRVNR